MHAEFSYTMHKEFFPREAYEQVLCRLHLRVALENVDFCAYWINCLSYEVTTSPSYAPAAAWYFMILRGVFSRFARKHTTQHRTAHCVANSDAVRSINYTGYAVGRVVGGHPEGTRGLQALQDLILFGRCRLRMWPTAAKKRFLGAASPPRAPTA